LIHWPATTLSNAPSPGDWPWSEKLTELALITSMSRLLRRMSVGSCHVFIMTPSIKLSYPFAGALAFGVLSESSQLSEPSEFTETWFEPCACRSLSSSPDWIDSPAGLNPSLVNRTYL
jgi:hypothetical protein